MIKQGKTRGDFVPTQIEKPSEKWVIRPPRLPSFSKCKWVLSKSGQLPRESFPHSEHQEQLSEKRREASPPLALDTTSEQPKPMLAHRPGFISSDHAIILFQINLVEPPILTDQGKTSPKAVLLLEANFPRRLQFKVWLEQIDTILSQGSRALPNHITARKHWQYSLEKTEREMLRTFGLNPSRATDNAFLFLFQPLDTIVALNTSCLDSHPSPAISVLCDFVQVT